MLIHLLVVALICVSWCIMPVVGQGTLMSQDEAVKKLKSAESLVEKEMASIWKTWDIDNYPNFLQSAGITHTSWEVMKLKYKAKILNTLLDTITDEEKSFVVAYMGSSVTAGHDSPVKDNFVSLTQTHMEAAFQELGIKFESRQSGMGNNPCEPYDLCPKTFSGEDADVVHWEQSYNCFGNDNNKQGLFEQFVRQCIHMPRKPVVVFSESATPNWHEKDCPEGTLEPSRRHLRKVDVSIAAQTYLEEAQRPDFAAGWDLQSTARQEEASAWHHRQLEATQTNIGWEKTREEESLVKLAKEGNYLKIAADINAPTIPKEWGANVKMFQAYQTQAGIQVWSHRHYEAYKCRGPYIPEWGCCAASWHPSLKGHALRAAHHSFFWLAIFKEAIIEIQKKLEAKTDMNAQLEDITKHIDKEINHVPDKALYKTLYSDNMQCMTTFEPRFWDGGDMRKYVISSGDNKPVWTDKIIESIQQQNIIDKAKATGYTDFKFMLYGNKDSTKLSLTMDIALGNTGTFFLCEPPGNWGKLPKGFTTIWEGKTDVYITTDVPADVTKEDKFVFEESKAKKLTYVNRKPTDSQVICVDFDTYKVPKGHHVLTIVPNSEDNIMVSMLVLPQ